MASRVRALSYDDVKFRISETGLADSIIVSNKLQKLWVVYG